jgi:hypothetical protein
MGKPVPTRVATVAAVTVAEEPAAPRLDLRTPSVPPPTELRPRAAADRIKDALLRWLEEEM